MNCPVCRAPMLILEYHSVEIDYCPQCSGCWLDRGELGLFLSGKIDAGESYALKGERPSKRRCPRCSKRLRAGDLPDVGIEVDTCVDGHGIWFDRDELLKVVQRRGTGVHRTQAEQWLKEVFGGNPQTGGTT